MSERSPRAHRGDRRLAAATAAGLLLLSPEALPAAMLAPSRTISIPAGPLAAALRDYARKTHRQILFEPALVRGRRARPVRNVADPDAALALLLKNSGLRARRLGADIVIIEPEEQHRTAPPHAVPPAPPIPPAPEDIIVTALKRQTVLADTPVSMTVLGGDELARAQIFDERGAARKLPGLIVTEGSTLEQRLTVRGVSGSGEATVGVYYGDTPVSGPSGTTADPAAITPDIDLVDIDRIELLRGPQGTLYGASSMGGTLRVLFNQPDASRWSAQVTAGLDVVEQGEAGAHASAVLNAPLVRDHLAARFVVSRRKSGGYIDNPLLGYENGGGVSRKSWRAMLAWTPSAAITISGTVLHQDSRSDDATFWLPDVGRYLNDQPVRTPNSSVLDLYTGAAQWNLGAVTLTANASRYEWHIVKESDFSAVLAQQRGSQASCVNYFGEPAGSTCSADQMQYFSDLIDSRLPAVLYQPMPVASTSGEVRLTSNGDGPFLWTLGAFAERRHDSVDSYVLRADPISGDVLRPFDVTGLRGIETTLDQQAIFAEATARLTRRLSLTGGGRYFHYRRAGGGSVTIANPITGTGVLEDTDYRQSESGRNLKFALSYQLSRSNLVYATAAEGFRPGGLNVTPGLSEEQQRYDADHLWSYEIGARIAPGAGRLQLEGALYHIDWSNMIYAVTSLNGAFGYNTNVGRVNINGAEAKLQLSLAPFRIASWVSYVDARLAEDQRSATAGGLGRKGDALPNVPHFTYSLSVDADARLGKNAVITFGADLAGATDNASRFDPDIRYYDVTKAHMTANLHATLAARDWRVTFHLDNVFDAVAPLNTVSSTFGLHRLYSSQPRTAGLEISRSF
jgi:outer membrane receptor protein involved in Fe transport